MIRRRSQKTRAIYDEWAPARRTWLLEHPICSVCGGPACEVHEILAGAHRMKAFVERCCWLRTCRTCHDDLQGEGKARQLARKLLSDPEGFDLGRTLWVWGRAPSAITADEVLGEVQFLLLRGAA